MRPFLFYLALTLTALAEQVVIYGEPVVEKPTTAPAPPPPPNQPAPSPAIAPVAAPQLRHVVSKGDSLWKIGKQYQVPIETIKTLNQLKSDQIKIGQVLIIMPAAVAAPEVRRALPVDDSPAPLPPNTPDPIIPPAPAPAPAKSSSRLLQEKFLTATKAIAARGVGYNKAWRPPGEKNTWIMDCSNTTRWLYREVAGIQLERTASSQYDQLYKTQRAWLAPRVAQQTDLDQLRRRLRVGDLLFWENTYRPVRSTPITHVMIYLGRDENGRMLMAGSQTSRGFYNPRGNGPDVYEFKPQRNAGGYHTGFFGMTRVTGRFIAYGRPLQS
jgi:LysM repeat protein